MASLCTETNTFSSMPTGLIAFTDHMVRRNASCSDPNGIGAGLHVFRTLAEADGWTVLESLSAFAEPAGLTVQSAYETLRDLILEDLRAAGPVGMVLLALHGAMMASDCEDCEGDLIASVRAIVGPHVPIGVELDPHCHLTRQMVATADAIVIMKEYPHTDWNDRARELYAICAAQVAGRVKPVTAVFDCRMVGFYPTTVAPMSGIVQMLKDAEREPGILSVSLAHGFPWGDHPETGTRLMVIADGDLAKAQATAERLGRVLYAARDALLPRMPGIDEAFAQAREKSGLIVMADTADNSGGGAPGDSTVLLGALMGAALGPCAFGALYDPGAVRICEEAGIGARLMLRIGGKTGTASGHPLDVEVEVMALAPAHQQTVFGSKAPFGPSAWVRIRDIDVVLVSMRSQVYGRDAFTALGISLTDKRIVAVKSSTHFRADFSAIADHIILIATPGTLQMDFASINYRRKRDMNFHPHVPDPLNAGVANKRLIPATDAAHCSDPIRQAKLAEAEHVGNERVEPANGLQATVNLK